MVDALTAPGMVAGILPFTHESLHRLSARLAHIIAAELSRQRAEVAFAQSSGSAIHSPEGQSDSLRAQQVSVTGNTLISLTTQTSLYAEGSRTAAHHFRDAERVGDDDAERHSADHDSCDADESGVDEGSTGRAPATLLAVLRQTLIQFREMASDAGFTGSPIALVLPAHSWVSAYAPANIKQSINALFDEDTDTLILCLAFDGTLGSLRTVMGLIFRGDRVIGSVNALWSGSDNVELADYHAVRVSNIDELVSEICADCVHGQVQGFRVKIDAVTDELACWSWQAQQWSWI